MLNVRWTTAPNSGGDPANGLDGLEPARIGADFGNERDFIEIDGSGNSVKLLTLPKQTPFKSAIQGVNPPNGRYAIQLHNIHDEYALKGLPYKAPLFCEIWADPHIQPFDYPQPFLFHPQSPSNADTNPVLAAAPCDAGKCQCDNYDFWHIWYTTAMWSTDRYVVDQASLYFGTGASQIEVLRVKRNSNKLLVDVSFVQHVTKSKKVMKYVMCASCALFI